MKTQNAKPITTGSFLVAALAVGMLLFSFSTQSFGQKDNAEPKRATSRDGLTEAGYLTKADVLDEFDGNEDEYFYQFKAIPGKLTLTVEITANQTVAGVTVDVFGPNSKAIMSNILVQAANRGTDRSTESVNLIKAQDVVIRIKGNKYGSSGGYPGVYKIRLEGPAVNFKDVASSEGAGVVEKPADAPTNEMGQDPSPNAAQSDNKGQDKKPATGPGAENGKDKKSAKVDSAIDKAKKESSKWLDVLEKVKTIKP